MLYKEFVTLTETEVSDEEYSYIEQSYYDSGLDKAEFCKLWKNDMMCGKWAAELALRRKLDRMTEELKDREKKIAGLEEQLDREQEWEPAENTGTHLPQYEYIDLREDDNSRELPYLEAKKLIAKEFGFQVDLIAIIREVETYEVNRHHKLRHKETFTREPIYNATDWNYIRFNVANLQYEMINGELEQYCN